MCHIFFDTGISVCISYCTFSKINMKMGTPYFLEFVWMENFINLPQDATNLTGPTPGRFGPDRPEG